jgi:pimeloyl-ACP methyl ester carboxylesterase
MTWLHGLTADLNLAALETPTCTWLVLHGAWHGAWCWQRVAPLLERRGIRGIAPDLPGMGEDRTALSAITLDAWTGFAANLVKQQPEPVVLVGHSRVGIVISQAGEHVPDRIAALVYLAAFLVPDSASLWSTMQQLPRDPLRPPDRILSDDRTRSTLMPTAIRDTQATPARAPACGWEGWKPAASMGREGSPTELVVTRHRRA